MSERYLRQQTIPNWDQERLTEASLLIVGGNQIAAALAAGAAAMGIGQIVVMNPGSQPTFLSEGAGSGVAPAQTMRDALSAINAEVEVRCSTSSVGPAQIRAACNPSVIAAVTSDKAELEACARVASSLGVPLVVGVGGPTGGAYAVLEALGDPRGAWHAISGSQKRGREASSAAIGCVIGGLMLGEIRSHLMSLSPRDRVTPKMIGYDSTSPNRFSAWALGERRQTSRSGSMRGAASSRRPRIALAGAGALGTWFCIALTDALTSGADITIFDPDTVEAHNLNRQVLYAGHVGELKADLLAAFVTRVRPDIAARAQPVRVPPPWIREHADEIDVVVSTVDNFRARAEFNTECVRAGVPLVNGGSGPTQADVAVYLPAVSACLDCQLQVNRLAAEEPDEATSCARTVESSTVISNMIAGGLAAAETVGLLTDPAGVPTGVLAYDAFVPRRLGMRPPRPACDCAGAFATV